MFWVLEGLNCWFHSRFHGLRMGLSRGYIGIMEKKTEATT